MNKRGTFTIVTQSAPGQREVEGEIFGQYGVYETSFPRDNGETMKAYYITHLPTGMRVGFTTTTFGGFAYRGSAVRVAELWAEHAPQLGAGLKLGEPIPATAQHRAFAIAVAERIALEYQTGRDAAGPFKPPPIE